ncbi:type IV toxin-antitoxin system AbiEi family antitoxin domain-containing protein [Furfurilactobacillus sp. WILCCON 0119]
MNQKELISQLLSQQGQTFTAAQALNYGITRRALNYWTKAGLLERIKNGVYGSTKTFEDPFYSIQSRLSKGIYDSITGLFLYGYSNETPSTYSLAFPANYHLGDSWSGIYQINAVRRTETLYNRPTSLIKSPYGNELKVYSLERCLINLWLDPRESADRQYEALNKYVIQSHHDLSKLHAETEFGPKNERLLTALEVLINA